MDEKKNREDSTVGHDNPSRDAIGAAMWFITSVTGLDLAQKYDLQPEIDCAVYQSTKSGLKTLGAANRQLKKISGSGRPERPAEEVQAAQEAAAEKKAEKLFDLAPTEDQQMIVETVKEFAEPRLCEATYKSNHEVAPSENLVPEVSELGVIMINVPKASEGIVTGEDVTIDALVAGALSYGDMGLALAVLAPAGVAATLTAHGSDSQQKTYLPAFVGENVPAATVAPAEPRPPLDARKPEAAVKCRGDSLILNGVKSFVPNASVVELLIIGVELGGKPVLVIIESDTESLHIKANPSMGLRGTAMGRVILKDVKVPTENILSGASTSAASREEAYLDILRRSHLGWIVLAMGTFQAALDYVILYVNECQAFGEPTSRRQAAASMTADIKIEFDGLCMITLRGVFHADQGCGFAREAALAKTFVVEKGMRIGSNGVQLLDGHGSTKEHPVECWYCDLRVIGAAEGIVVL